MGTSDKNLNASLADDKKQELEKEVEKEKKIRLKCLKLAYKYCPPTEKTTFAHNHIFLHISSSKVINLANAYFNFINDGTMPELASEPPLNSEKEKALQDSVSKLNTCVLIALVISAVSLIAVATYTFLKVEL
ncbi:hypothetical protein [Bacteroides propionicifaciens]|uniref:hypothetical protein n=1 Tax=Bacteroides propionicifaciens TaxID=392838 RepID=UPI0003731412|nr:hypothetical protein [Bacteroides propionicifaciens]